MCGSASHRRSGLPNQDALGWMPEDGTGPPLLLAVADGHGSHRYIRSQHGARLAVETAREVAGRFFPELAALDWPELQQRIERDVPAEIGRRWVERVREHIAEQPVSAEELAALEAKAGAEVRSAIQAEPLTAYGATLMAVAITDSFIAYLQLGDGDVVIISETGALARPLPDDPRLFANETTSLSSAKDREAFRVTVQPITSSPPAVILACTDGYANSYPGVQDPIGEFGFDLWKLIGSHGLTRVKANLGRWLTETTDKGSGDDITLGIICRADAFGKDGKQG
jgi:hypothetical protein